MVDVSKCSWPTNIDDYEIKRTIGHGATSLVQTALCKPRNEHVAVKIIDFEQSNSVIDEIQKEIQAMNMCNHENVVNYYTSFVHGSELWIIMKLMDGGSVLDLLAKMKKHPDTIPNNGIMNETMIVTILKEVVKALGYFHDNGQIHRDVKAGNILIGLDGSVRLADFGVSAVIMDFEDRKKIRKTFVGTPCWMAPEVMEQSMGYNNKADIWSLGITALEMATGEAPYARYPAMKVLIRTLNEPSPTLESCADGQKDMFKQYSKPFRKFIAQCLQKDASLRPDTKEILKMKLFKGTKDKSYLTDQFNHYGACLIDRSYHMKPQTKSRNSGRWQKDPSGFWIWPDFQEEVANGVEGSAAGEVVVKVAPAPTEEHQQQQESHFPRRSSHVASEDTSKQEQDHSLKYAVILRIRNKIGDLVDIFFRYDTFTDKPEAVVQEMVTAELVKGQDWISISANLRKLIYDNMDAKDLIFPLKSGSGHGIPDEEKLIGYAQLVIEEGR